MRRIALLLTLSTMTACSLGMKRVEPDYDPRTIPRCETSAGPPVGDALAAILAIGGAAVIAIAAPPTDNEGVSKWVWVAGLGVVGGLEALIAKGGFGWHRQCDEVKRGWDQMQIEQDELVQREAAEIRLEQAKAREARKSPPVPAVTPAARGFYCSSGTTTGFCVRDKAECMRTRSIAIANVPDLSECALTESAWCAGDVCTPTQDGCASGGGCERRE